MKEFEIVIALDQGTTSCRAIAFDRSGNVQGIAQKPLAQHYPQPGWVEHDADEILRTQVSVLHEVMAGSRLQAAQIKAIGITNQRETVVLWDRLTGKPVHPAIVWQCRRTAPMCTELKNKGLEPQVMARTGLRLDAYFSASKIRWLLDNVPQARELAAQDRLLAGTMDSWLIWNLSGRQVHVTDSTNASRTLLVDIRTGEYAPDMLELFGVPAAILPKIVPSSGIAACLDEAILPGNIPIAGIAGDQQSALFGQACFTPGMVKNTYGTGCFIMMQTGQDPVFSEHGLLTTIAYDLGSGPVYALEGSVFNTGSAIQWLRDELEVIKTSAECDRLAEQVADTGGIHFVPAFTGLGAPHWTPDARGIITGITRGTNKAHLARAVLEAIAFQSYEVIEAMAADADCAITELRADGGASVSEFLMQFQSDLLNIPVDRPRNIETTAFGAAALAGLAVGFYPNLEAIAASRERARVFQPQHDSDWRQQKLAGWRHAIATAVADSKP
ncbi:MAG: glycerol kinase GlpK [Saccharofermentanales bacterium]